MESSCVNASSSVYLNWSAPDMSSHTRWNTVLSFWAKLSWHPANETIFPLVIFKNIVIL